MDYPDKVWIKGNGHLICTAVITILLVLQFPGLLVWALCGWGFWFLMRLTVSIIVALVERAK